MGKTRAEIQKAYRQRLKERLGEEYNRKERIRIRQNYIPAAQLSNKKRTERNRKNKLRNMLCRQRKRDQLQQMVNQESENDCTSGYGSAVLEDASSNEAVARRQPLIVKLPAVTNRAKANGPRRARVRALARAHKTIKELKDEQVKLQKKLASKRQQIARLTKKIKTAQSTCNMDSPLQRTEKDVAELHLTPRRQQIAKRKLMFANVLLSEIRSAKNKTSLKKRQVLHRLVVGKIARKYKCVNSLSHSTGLSRKSLGNQSSKLLEYSKEKRSCASRKVKHVVVEFLSREDNSRIQPGKADIAKTSNGKKSQTLVLTDYLRNLYRKFSAEYPDIRISFTSFCRLRPKNILLAKFICRNACQCLRHQNMAFKVQTLRNHGAKLSKNPENILLHEDNLDDLFNCVQSGQVNFKIWKRVELGNKQKKMKVVEKQVGREEFIEIVKEEIIQFSSHVQRLRTQFQQLKVNKETLKPHHMIVQMDFAENFSCRSLDEVQTAYWNQSSVTIHPVVVYFKSGEELKHKSLVVVSDETTHSASTVAAFLDAVIPELHKIDPELQKIHYWTDSPSSQYRNRYMFRLLANHKELYRCEAQWNYFEAGHGKSACDGLGGTTKRLADEAVRQGNTAIQDAHDFFAWAVQSSMKEVTFIFVDKDKCKQKADEFAKCNVKPVKDTMKLHAIVYCNLAFRTSTTSCYCDQCLEGAFCTSWAFEVQKKTSARQKCSSGGSKRTNANITIEGMKVGEYIAARYEGSWYVGQIEEIDNADEDCKVNFMEETKGLFKWPRSRDELWINGKDILCKVTYPQKTGKYGRTFKITDEEKQKIENLFKRS